VNQPEAPGKVLQRLSLVQRQGIQLGRGACALRAGARCAAVEQRE